MDSSSATWPSFSAVTDEEFNIFHLSDRKLFTILINNLSLDLNDSVSVMGFWLWLEQDHIKDLSIVHKILQLSYRMLNQVVHETVFCLKLIKHDTIQPENVGMEFHFLQTLTGKPFSLQQLHSNRFTVLDGVSRLINEVCVRAFRDIIENFLKTPKQNHVHNAFFGDVSQHFDPLGQGFAVAPTHTRAMGGPSDLTGHGVPMRVMGEPSDRLGSHVAPGQLGLMQGGNHEIRPPFYPGPTPFHHGMQFQGPAYSVQFLGNMPRFSEGPPMHMMGNYEMFNNQMYKEDVDKRTIFLAYWKGYTVSEDEIREFFTRRFGEFIESVQMPEVEGDDKVLYARVIANSVAMVDRVMKGRRLGKAKYCIKGKRVRLLRSTRPTHQPESD